MKGGDIGLEDEELDKKVTSRPGSSPRSWCGQGRHYSSKPCHFRVAVSATLTGLSLGSKPHLVELPVSKLAYSFTLVPHSTSDSRCHKGRLCQPLLASLYSTLAAIGRCRNSLDGWHPAKMVTFWIRTRKAPCVAREDGKECLWSLISDAQPAPMWPWKYIYLLQKYPLESPGAISLGDC